MSNRLTNIRPYTVGRMIVNGTGGEFNERLKQMRPLLRSMIRTSRKAGGASRAAGADAQTNLEMLVSLQVMNSSSAGVPFRVCSMPRLIAGTISSGSVTRSP